MDIDNSRLLAAFQTARQALLAQRDSSGHWLGRLASSALSTATAVSALAIVERHGKTDDTGRYADEQAEARLNDLIVRGLGYLAECQNADGGWGDTDLSLSNIATTMLVKAAFCLTGLPADDEGLLDRADAYIATKGGIAGLRRRYGRDKTFAVPILANCALAGVVPWREVSALPLELACLPQHWFRYLHLPVVSYAIPALVAIGQAKFHFDPPWYPLRWLRRAAFDKSLRVLEQMQPQSGGFLEATPLTSFVVMSLAGIGHADHPVVRRGVEFLVASAREDGSWPIDSNLATWNTTLAVNALATDPEFDVGCSEHQSVERVEHRTSNVQGPTSNLKVNGAVPEARLLGEAGLLKVPEREGLLDWLLHCQLRQTHPYTGAAPGGWAWTDLSGGVPDVDDTSGALLALSHLRGTARSADNKRIVVAAAAGVNWLLDLQNSDGGWPTFCRGWGTMPFDRSATDLTAHAMRALHAWRPALVDVDVDGSDSHSERSEQSLATRIDEAIHRGFVFLRKSQHAGGCWMPLWFGNQHHPTEENPVYGTARVLLAYRDLDHLDTPEAQQGLAWLTTHQNLDGGWGGAALAAGTSGAAGDRLETRSAMRHVDRQFGSSGASSKPRLHQPRHPTDSSLRLTANGQPGANGKVSDVVGRAVARNEGRVIDHPQSTVEETALAVEALCAAADGRKSDASLEKARHDGLTWLVEAVETKHFMQCSPIGFYFAKLWYYEQLYPLIFTVSALGSAAHLAAQRLARQPGTTDSLSLAPALVHSHPHPVSLTR